MVSKFAHNTKTRCRKYSIPSNQEQKTRNRLATQVFADPPASAPNKYKYPTMPYLGAIYTKHPAFVQIYVFVNVTYPKNSNSRQQKWPDPEKHATKQLQLISLDRGIRWIHRQERKRDTGREANLYIWSTSIFRYSTESYVLAPIRLRVWERSGPVPIRCFYCACTTFHSTCPRRGGLGAISSCIFDESKRLYVN